MTLAQEKTLNPGKKKKKKKRGRLPKPYQANCLAYLEKRRRISQCNLEVEYAYNLKFVSTTTNPWAKREEARA